MIHYNKTDYIKPGQTWETHSFHNVVAKIVRTEPEPDQTHADQIRVYFTVAHRPGEELWCWRDAFMSIYVPTPE